ncbi:hypothetical protein SAMN05421768_106299 [Chryseobacterium joostei]|uniref:Uncharacterized protein n=1 Tax=Chryseobacterium joostei TaxID=112234 RepID=A0A1N7IRR1_9FLAO|nr:hypothetical protein [Chryseobacterium joostei]SIS39710.1 hypothetical protein SAMN05421768_106299 [Chryseobacterium joostei]
MFKINQKISLVALLIYSAICVSLILLLFKSIIPGVVGIIVGYSVFVIVLLLQQLVTKDGLIQAMKNFRENAKYELEKMRTVFSDDQKRQKINETEKRI